MVWVVPRELDKTRTGAPALPVKEEKRASLSLCMCLLVRHMADGCRHSGVTLISTYGKRGSSLNRVCSSWLLSTSRLLTFLYSPTTRQICAHLPERCRDWEYSFSRALISFAVSEGRALGILTVISTMKSI